MKLSNVLLVGAFAGEAVASWGFGKSGEGSQVRSFDGGIMY
jgi:hypothetical protein